MSGFSFKEILTEPITAAVLGGIGTAFVGFLGRVFWRHRDAKTKALQDSNAARQLLQDRVAELEEQLKLRRLEFENQLSTVQQNLNGQIDLLRQSVAPLSTLMLSALTKELTRSDSPEFDKLMAKAKAVPYELTHDEEVRMVELAEERATLVGTLMTESERDAAKMLPMVIKRVKADALNTPTLTSMALGVTDEV